MILKFYLHFDAEIAEQCQVVFAFVLNLRASLRTSFSLWTTTLEQHCGHDSRTFHLVPRYDCRPMCRIQFVNLFLRITVRAPMVPHLVTAILAVFTMFLVFLCNTLTSCYSSQTVDDRSLTNDARNKMTQSESESKWKNLSCSSGVPICKIDRPILCRRNTYSKVTALWRSCCFSWAFLELHLCA